MYLDIKEIKATTAIAYADKIGSITMNHIIHKIREAAAIGKTEVRINFKDYPMLNMVKENIDNLVIWAKLCGYITAKYDDCVYIKWY